MMKNRDKTHRDTDSVDDSLSNDAIAILDAALLHVPFDGWGRDTLLAGAEDSGRDVDMVDALFPNGAVDAILMHSARADVAMADTFATLPDRPEKIHLMIRTLILLRLEQASLHKEAIRRGLAVLAVPANAPASAKALYRTVDAMWRAAGQRDTDFSFYTKRATLAGVYSATLLAWLADNSGSMTATEAFLDRRLREIGRIPKMTAPAKAAMSAGKRMAMGLFSTMARSR
ncbi:COQ9 family protein [Candidatus Puniceispirillum sp.]|uniref:COQ9 family protein n=1 Tax=Candidatus Puniceispirillum sp. TaxID=2026719 RepID=UPI003F69E0D6